ncbi:hypothetical protein PCASD_16469 [Puccinia coronata f. sp. avenae]|uniref:Uncharacterized protein n=1 Tax=Puccinia coronata f. sp. avenae TaxID=200324 RepID=A0A2N5TXD0_9BASI|nr:hypothetical protein PCASD_16469 [Puccinia coronata f. sp. avenae]
MVEMGGSVQLMSQYSKVNGLGSLLETDVIRCVLVGFSFRRPTCSSCVRRWWLFVLVLGFNRSLLCEMLGGKMRLITTIILSIQRFGDQANPGLMRWQREREGAAVVRPDHRVPPSRSSAISIHHLSYLGWFAETIQSIPVGATPLL